MRGLTVATLIVCLGTCACSNKEDTVPGVAAVMATLTPARVEAGGPVLVSYSFTPAAGSTLPADQWVFVHALDAGNELLWTDDHAPPTPTQNWTPGQAITYRRPMFVPRGTPPGDIRIEVGLFSKANGERLPLAGRARGMRSYEVGTAAVVATTNPVVAGDGWHNAETGEGPGREWQWSRKEAKLLFRNPKAAAVLYLQVNQPVTTLQASQAVEVRTASGVVSTFKLAPGTTQLVRIPLSTEQMGTAETVELSVGVDATFVPAAMTQLKSGDTRELGIRLLNAFVGPPEGVVPDGP